MERNELEKHIRAINKMDHTEMARFYRFSSLGHPYFTEKILSVYFMCRFESFGGMTVKMSKHIGWK
jgi:hypothetical protein